MVGRGETVFLCGVFQEATVRDFARTVGSGGQVIVLEANPGNVQRLRSQVQLPQVQILNRAVWHEDCDLEFEFAPDEEAQHYNRVHSDVMQPFPTHLVSEPDLVTVRGELIATTADALGIGRIDHLNLTVNGAEREAFRGPAGASLADRVAGSTPTPSSQCQEKSFRPHLKNSATAPESQDGSTPATH